MFSQGFDWEYSVRLPFSIPKVYMGVQFGAATYLHTGAIQQIERQVVCIDYNNGSGTGYYAGVIGEWWLDGDFSLLGSAAYQKVIANFTQQTTPIPLSENNFFISEYSLYAVLPTLSVAAAVKSRLFETKAWVFGGLTGNVIISKDVQSSETIISPTGRVFNDGKQKRVFTDDFTSLRSFTVLPELGIGYDASLGNGIYASPSFIITFPIMNNSSIANWRIWSLKAGVCIFYGL